MTPRTYVWCSALALGSFTTACGGGDDAKPADAYCGQVAEHVAAIETPAMATPDDVQATLALYRNLADAAPAAVEPEWRTVVAALETAATVVPSDAASMARMSDAALSGQPAYTRIQQYTSSTCGTDIGGPPPVATNPVTATTIPDPDATGPSTTPAAEITTTTASPTTAGG